MSDLEHRIIQYGKYVILAILATILYLKVDQILKTLNEIKELLKP